MLYNGPNGKLYIPRRDAGDVLKLNNGNQDNKFEELTTVLYDFTAPDTRQKMIRLISIDLTSRERLSDLDLSSLTPGKHFCNDLTFD